MSKDGRAQLCDYGLLRLIRQSEFVGGRIISTSFINSARYLAPELVQDEQTSTFESDVYALGCVGYEVCL